jgi:hypothetical protein
MLRGTASVRKIASDYGLSKTALSRHRQHMDETEPATEQPAGRSTDNQSEPSSATESPIASVDDPLSPQGKITRALWLHWQGVARSEIARRLNVGECVVSEWLSMALEDEVKSIGSVTANEAIAELRLSYRVQRSELIRTVEAARRRGHLRTVTDGMRELRQLDKLYMEIIKEMGAFNQSQDWEEREIQRLAKIPGASEESLAEMQAAAGKLLAYVDAGGDQDAGGDLSSIGQLRSPLEVGEEMVREGKMASEEYEVLKRNCADWQTGRSCDDGGGAGVGLKK